MRLARGLLVAVGMTFFAVAAEAEPVRVSTKARADVFAKQLKVLDGRASEQYSFSTRLQPDFDELSGLKPGRFAGRPRPASLP